jgi:3-oxoacyl-[acyl-carrier-protein] synthase II
VIVPFGCQVRGLDGLPGATVEDTERLDPYALYALAAALAAYEDAGSPTPDPDRAAVAIGNGVAGQANREKLTCDYIDRGPAAVDPGLMLTTLPSAAPAHVAMRLGWRGPTLSVSTACASSGNAIGEALQLLRAGRADVAIAGGSEATLTAYVLTSFANLQALSRRTDDPAGASRPFDVDRDGFVMGEGAAFVVLERLHDARARGATPYATLAGYAANTDAYHLVMPATNGTGAAHCMTNALTDAELTPRDIVHVNAHGTSTPLNDRAEADALHSVFGEHPPPVTANKGVLGHLIGAAGAVELVAAVLSLRHHTIPPPPTTTNPTPTCTSTSSIATPAPSPPAPSSATPSASEATTHASSSPPNPQPAVCGRGLAVVRGPARLG